MNTSPDTATKKTTKSLRMKSLTRMPSSTKTDEDLDPEDDEDEETWQVLPS